MKSPTRHRRPRGDVLALHFPLRLLRGFLLSLCLLRHCALLANPSWRSDEVHLHIARAHTSMYYNEMKKTLSRLNEALTRLSSTMNATRDAANFLSSAPNYFAQPEISPSIFRQCRKPLQNAAFLHAMRAFEQARPMSFGARADTRDGEGIVSEVAENRREKFFWNSSRIPPSSDRNASQNARITRQPIRARNVARASADDRAIENAPRNVAGTTEQHRFASHARRRASRHASRGLRSACDTHGCERPNGRATQGALIYDRWRSIRDDADDPRAR
jgi:hypothetical protein